MKKGVTVNHIILISLLAHLIGIILFISGFLPIKKSITGFSSEYDFPNLANATRDIRPPKPKIVLIVIDALRADFIPTIAGNKYEAATMPFLEELLNNGSAQGFISRAQNPTVTLPRIKAIMSGTVPAFLDVILNLDAGSSKDDSLIIQAHRANQKIIFYGDDTWIKLFGNNFHAYEGTTSFFVNDFVEVDHNVTRHLDQVLKQSDWEWLILHYLGLDHIGHLAGPTSPLIRLKLKEMDEVVRKVRTALTGQKHIIVITGDHGMTSSGSHGGATLSEVLTPLIFASSQSGTVQNVEDVMQVDITPTLAVLMQLPIPKNSIGKLITSFLEREKITEEEILNGLYSNVNQVSTVFKINQKSDVESSLQALIHLHKAWLLNKNPKQYLLLKTGYLELIRQMSSELEHSVSGYDIYAMILGFATTFAALLSISRIAGEKGITMLGEEMVFTKIMILVPSIIAACSVQFLACLHTHSLCASPLLWPIPILSLTYFMYHLLQCSYLLPSILSGKDFTIGIELFVIGSASLHVLSLGSSSFIEEEHQTWYFFTTTLILLLFLRNIRHIISSFDITLEIGFLQRSSPGNFSVYRKSLLKKMGFCLSLLILCRLAQSWNQTGNKWAHLSDIGDYLRERNQNLLAIITVISILAILVLSRTHRIFQQCSLLLATLAIMAYHLESIHMSGVTADRQILAWVVYIVILAHALENFLHVVGRSGRKYSLTRKCQLFIEGLSTSWMLLSLLLCRTHNVPLYLIMMLQEKLIHKLVWSEPMSFFVRTSAYTWTAMCCFFYQGNSNMISTLDVSSGYVGLSTYKPVVVALLIICNTYSGFVYFLLQYAARLCQASVLQVSFSIVNSSHIAALLCIRYASITTYTVVVIYLRHHLFIWSVFAPKLLYEGAHSVIFTCFILLILVLANITNRKHK